MNYSFPDGSVAMITPYCMDLYASRNRYEKNRLDDQILLTDPEPFLRFENRFWKMARKDQYGISWNTIIVPKCDLPQQIQVLFEISVSKQADVRVALLLFDWMFEHGREHGIHPHFIRRLEVLFHNLDEPCYVSWPAFTANTAPQPATESAPSA